MAYQPTHTTTSGPRTLRGRLEGLPEGDELVIDGEVWTKFIDDGDEEFRISPHGLQGDYDTEASFQDMQAAVDEVNGEEVWFDEFEYADLLSRLDRVMEPPPFEPSYLDEEVILDLRSLEFMKNSALTEKGFSVWAKQYAKDADPAAYGLPSTTKAVSDDARAALKRINEHRASIGQAPLDPVAAGWGPDDVAAEAQRIARLPNITAMPAPPMRTEAIRRRLLAEEEEEEPRMQRRPSPGDIARVGSRSSSTAVSRRQLTTEREPTVRLHNKKLNLKRNLILTDPAGEPVAVVRDASVLKRRLLR